MLLGEVSALLPLLGFKRVFLIAEAPGFSTSSLSFPGDFPLEIIFTSAGLGSRVFSGSFSPK